MRNTILILLGTIITLFAFSSCDETELINPQEERTILGLDDENEDNDGVDDGTYTLEAEEATDVRTTVGGEATVSDLTADPMDTEGNLTLAGYNDLANGVITTTDDATIRTNYDNDGQSSTTDPIDPTEVTRSVYFTNETIGETSPRTTSETRFNYGSDAGQIGNTSPKVTNSRRSSYRSADNDNTIPVMPEDRRATTLRSRSSSMQ